MANVTFFIGVYLLFYLSAGAQKLPVIRHVIIIGVDALSPAGIIKGLTPHLDTLMQNGAYSLKAKAVFPSLSAPNWASMIMGVSPKQHHIRGNDWKLENIKGNDLAGNKNGEHIPTIFKAVREKNPHADISCFHEWKEFERLVEKEIFTTIQNTSGENNTNNTACAYILNNKPLLTFIHLDHVDEAGHKYGHGSLQYIKAVERADSIVGQILHTVKTAGIYNETVILVTSDHGGKGKHHGSRAAKNMRVPWIITGPGVITGKKIEAKIHTYDTAATIAYILGLTLPAYYNGKPVISAFKK